MYASVISAALIFGIVAPPMPDGEMMHSIIELDEFADDPERRFTPFCVTGTVQSIIRSSDAQFLIVTDGDSWAEVRNFSDCYPTPGTKIKITGRAHMSSHQEVDLAAIDVVPIGTGVIEPTRDVPLGNLDANRNHLQTVRTEGIVIDSFPDEIDPLYHFLILKDAETVIPIALKLGGEPSSQIDHLRDARLRITGQYHRVGSGSRKFSVPFISIENPSGITVIDPAPDNPFVAPRLENFSYRTPLEIARTGKRSVTGEVLAIWGEDKLMMRTDDRRIINITVAHEQFLPQAGENITAAGYPETDLFRVNLTRAAVRVNPGVTSFTDPEEQETTDLATVFLNRNGSETINPTSHGRLLRVRGTVQSAPSPDSPNHRLLLACGPYKLPVDLGPYPNAADGIPIGSVLEVTGRCLHEIDSWNPGDTIPRIRSLAAVIRKPADLKIISLPSWWTPLKLIIVISILLAALIGIYIWNRILQNLVNRRGRELYREQVAHAIAEFKTGERTRLAVELHDSLSQELAGVAYQVAASAKTLDKKPDVARRCIETADKMLSSCRTELRQCLFDLRSDTLDEPDFTIAIRKTLDQIDSDAKISVRFNIPRQRIKDTTAHAIISIIRELTGNAIRHGSATEVKIAGAIEPERIMFSVKDNGCGFDPANCNGPLQGHFGIEGIRNRLEKLDGTFTVNSNPGEGTKATVIIPLPKQMNNENNEICECKLCQPTKDQGL